ncbi:MAG TPA: HupE/UreJ family protein [Gallionellaceae bacterium]|nr:HupE/UreJ family protein [Gallionellaceae bacterium]
MITRLFLTLFLLTLPSAAHAHKPSDSYLILKTEGASVQGQWDIALRDLDFAIGLDGNGDGSITWGELRARHDAIAAYALPRLKIHAQDEACPTRATAHLVDKHSDGAYAVLRFVAECTKPLTAVELNYSLLFDVDPQHKGLLRLEYQGTTRTAIFSPDKSSQRFELAELSLLRQFFDYTREGVWHIWIGFDHILFLLSLLLPAVLYRSKKHWEAVPGFRPALLDVLKIVTAFTLAHSITLSLATLGVVTLPSRLVESAIAASVVLSALNNIFPLIEGRRWMVAFAFGLIHGFGFASVLADLGLPQDALLLALVGFNLGVEGGQLAIVSAFLPLAYFLRNTLFYRRAVLFAGSIMITLLASVWLVERVFDLKLLGF